MTPSAEPLAYAGRRHPQRTEPQRPELEIGLPHRDRRAEPVFRRSRDTAKVEQSRLQSGEIAIQVALGNGQINVEVTGRVTVDSSPRLRSALLELLGRGTAACIVIDLSAVSYLDTSGLATLLEALKAAHEHSVKLRVAGIAGRAKNLAKIAQLDTIFGAWGSEVDFG